MVENKRILKSPKNKLEEYKRTSVKFQTKGQFDYADMDDLRRDSPGNKNKEVSY